MDALTNAGARSAAMARRPRFRRADNPPPFRLTDDDIIIIRQLARYRFLRSTHIAALVGRSLDRTNDRLAKLFHAGYVDRPRAQLDRFPVGSAPYAYALADRGAHLLVDRYGSAVAHLGWSRKNTTAGRPFIEHQLETIDFWVALQTAPVDGIRLIHQDELIAGFPEATRNRRSPLTQHGRLIDDGVTHDVGVVPDLAFGLGFPDGGRRCFLVEIDRGTMPVTRRDPCQTSFARKMRTYLAAYAAREHERQFAWKAFRVLVVTTDDHRLRSMSDALRRLHVPQTPGSALFFFTTRAALLRDGPLRHGWRDGEGREVRLA
jgi:hypothetical protein